MNILEKLSSVEIKPESRISDADRRWCEAHADAYGKAISALVAMSGVVQTYAEEQRAALAPVLSQADLRYRQDKYIGKGFDPSDYLDRIPKIHVSFVDDVVNYFANKYGVTLEGRDIADKLVPAKPKEPDFSYMYYTSPKQWTPEQKEQYHASRDAYNAEVAAYDQQLRDLRIPYTDILDQIFIQLGGCSFEDKAIREIKDACHKASWYDHNGQPKFEQKKAVIHYTGYGCSIDQFHEKWKSAGEESEFHLTDGMKDVLRAASYFETDMPDYMLCSIGALFGYRVTGTEHEIGGTKIKSVKLFKNNRVDIRFSSEAYAREFAEQFMGTAA